MKKIIIYMIVAILFTACGSILSVNEKIIKEKNHKKNIYTNYVSVDYSKKDEGYDWVMVSLKDIDTHKARVSIKSRADKKKPTCTFDDIVYKKDNNQFVSYKDEKTILFEVKDDYLFIKDIICNPYVEHINAISMFAEVYFLLELTYETCFSIFV